MEALSGVKGDNSLKIFGPDLDQLELLADQGQEHLARRPRASRTWASSTSAGQSHLEFRVDPEKCQKWGVTTADVNNVVSSAVGAKAMSSMVEGEKLFDIAIRWPKWRRNNETSILDIPVDIINNQVVLAQGSGFTPNASRACLAAARGGRQPGRHVQPDQQHAANPARATWSRRWARTARRTPTASSIAPAPRPSTASRASA